jgi:hypothetical protein
MQERGIEEEAEDQMTPDDEAKRKEGFMMQNPSNRPKLSLAYHNIIAGKQVQRNELEQPLLDNDTTDGHDILIEEERKEPN